METSTALPARSGTANPDERMDPSPWPSPLRNGRGRMVASPFAMDSSSMPTVARSRTRTRTRTRRSGGSWRGPFGHCERRAEAKRPSSPPPSPGLWRAGRPSPPSSGGRGRVPRFRLGLGLNSDGSALSVSPLLRRKGRGSPSLALVVLARCAPGVKLHCGSGPGKR